MPAPPSLVLLLLAPLTQAAEPLPTATEEDACHSDEHVVFACLSSAGRRMAVCSTTGEAPTVEDLVWRMDERPWEARRRSRRFPDEAPSFSLEHLAAPAPAPAHVLRFRRGGLDHVLTVADAPGGEARLDMLRPDRPDRGPVSWLTCHPGHPVIRRLEAVRDAAGD